MRFCLGLAIAALVAAGCGRTRLTAADLPPEPDAGGAVTSVGGDGDGGAGGGDSAPPVPPTVTLRGTLVDSSNNKPIANAQITTDSAFGMTDATGTFSLTEPTRLPFAFSATAVGYLTLVEQPMTLFSDVDRGPIPMISSEATASMWATVMDYDPSLGIVAVQVIPTGACKSIAGAKLAAIGSSGSPKALYFQGRKPSAALASAQDGQLPTAFLYNVPTTQQITVSASGGECTQADYPVTYQQITWDGAVEVQAGDSLAFVRVFMK